MGRYFASAILVFVLIFAVAACSNPDKDIAIEPPESTSEPVAQIASAEPTPTSTPTQAPITQAAAKPTQQPLTPEQRVKNKEIIDQDDITDPERNRLWVEDIEFFREKLSLRYLRIPLAAIKKSDLNQVIDELISKVDQLSTNQIITELTKIIALLGDAHSNVEYWDGLFYPIRFRIIGGDVYIVDAYKPFEDMMFSRVVKINGVPIEDVIEKLSTVIPHENDYWVLAELSSKLVYSRYMYGLGIIDNQTETIFSVEKDGEAKDYTVPVYTFDQEEDLVNYNLEDTIMGRFEKNYLYSYNPENKTIYFQYNSCVDMKDLLFVDFFKDMDETIRSNDVEKIIVDLRNNGGGYRETLDPFTRELGRYVEDNPSLKVYTLIGHPTISAAMFAIYEINKVAPQAITVGVPTGGSLVMYADMERHQLPNSQIWFFYSIDFWHSTSQFTYRNPGQDTFTFIPDVELSPTIEDYINHNDVVLNYALEN